MSAPWDEYEHLLAIDGYRFVLNQTKLIGGAVIYLRAWLNVHWCKYRATELVLCLRAKSSSPRSTYRNYCVVLKNVPDQRELIDAYSQLAMLQSHIKTWIITQMKAFLVHTLTNGLSLLVDPDRNVLIQSTEPSLHLYQLDQNNLPMK